MSISDAELLRTPLTALNPDERTAYLGYRDIATGEQFNISLADQHRFISKYKLNDNVPQDIKIHFETAKNCYLYSWFVFRFYQVAEQHVCSTLEFALRERFPDFVNYIESISRGGKPPALESLLKHAMKKKVLANDLFPSRETWALELARERFLRSIHEELISSGASEITFDDSNVVASSDDLLFDWVSHYIKFLPMIRNSLAHGSGDLRHTVLRTFDVVSSMINMLYPDT